jgi:acyl carrier protein
MNAVGVDVSQADAEQAVRQFIQENFVLASGSTAELGVDDSLTQLGLIDSTGVLELIAFLEQSFSISISDEETVPENLDSVRKIVRFVGEKRGN